VCRLRVGNTGRPVLCFNIGKVGEIAGIGHQPVDPGLIGGTLGLSGVSLKTAGLPGRWQNLTGSLAIAGEKIDKIVGIESRGFIFGTAMAYKIGAGFVPVRKPGKLPAETISEEYQLEYGTDKVEIHVDAIDKGEKVLLVDDLLATGGTASAALRLLEKLEADVVGLSFLIELDFLEGRKKLGDYRVESVISY